MGHGVALFFGKGLKGEPKDEGSEDGYDTVMQDALDDLADILSVSDDDREKFDDGMHDLIKACIEMAKEKPKAKKSKVEDDTDAEDDTE